MNFIDTRLKTEKCRRHFSNRKVHGTCLFLIIIIRNNTESIIIYKYIHYNLNSSPQCSCFSLLYIFTYSFIQQVGGYTCKKYYWLVSIGAAKHNSI